MIDAETILRTSRTILVVDWPTSDLPETLVRAGYVVHVKSGPGPEEHVEYVLDRDGMVTRRPAAAPDTIDVLHVYRPIEELAGFVALARKLRATTVWYLSGLATDGTRDSTGCWLPPDQSADARRIVESAGLVYIQQPSIVETVRAMRVGGSRP
jgi:predicted CoA-binding protein